MDEGSCDNHTGTKVFCELEDDMRDPQFGRSFRKNWEEGPAHRGDEDNEESANAQPELAIVRRSGSASVCRLFASGDACPSGVVRHGAEAGRV